jgi:hypothetical protein
MQVRKQEHNRYKSRRDNCNMDHIPPVHLHAISDVSRSAAQQTCQSQLPGTN